MSFLGEHTSYHKYLVPLVDSKLLQSVLDFLEQTDNQQESDVTLE